MWREGVQWAKRPIIAGHGNVTRRVRNGRVTLGNVVTVTQVTGKCAEFALLGLDPDGGGEVGVFVNNHQVNRFPARRAEKLMAPLHRAQ